MSATDTPRTDEQERRYDRIYGAFEGDRRRLVYADFARTLESELAAAQAKIANQSERIRYLEGATNHATGTPLSQAQAKVAELEQDKDRLDWLEQNWLHWPIGRHADTIRDAIDAARKEAKP